MAFPRTKAIGGVMTDQRSGLRLGWLGTGRMGSALARRLLARGYDVAVFSRTKAKAEALAPDGAKILDSAADLAAADIVFVTVGTSQDLIDVLLGPDGLLDGPNAPGIVVDCTTVSVEASMHVRKRLEERGAALLAAPVMGNPKVARAGRLTLAVSGPRAAFDRAKPYLDVLGAGATYVGEGETARIVKLCHNLFLGVVTQSLAEVTVLAERYGVTREAFLACLNNSVMGSTFSKYKTPALVNLDFHPTFTARLLRKDFDLGLAAAREREVPLPVAAVVHQIVQSLIGRGYGDEDFAALLRLQAQSAGLTLVSEGADVSDGLEPDDLGTRQETR
jgi:3-hydroxyisobutyrate dehydrogenase